VVALIAIVLAQLAITQPARAAAPGDFWLMNGITGLCLDGSASQGVRMNTCSTASRYQLWYVNCYNIDCTDYELKNRANSNLCLDGTISSGARMLPCNGLVYQIWFQTATRHFSNYAYGVARSLDGSASQGVQMKVTASASAYQHWYWIAV
jgi:hypothetical protein